MNLKRGNMISLHAPAYDVIVVTGNATLKQNGALVMGRGAAKSARDIFSGCDLDFGRLIKHHRDTCMIDEPYGLLYLPSRKPILGLFQVKWHYMNQAELSLIEFSTRKLEILANADWQKYRIALNFPGIGNGGLSRELVWPFVKTLPDNIDVWEL